MRQQEYYSKKCDDAVELMTTISKELGKVDEIVSDLSFYFETHRNGVWEASIIGLIEISIKKLEKNLESIRITTSYNAYH